jgi:hypothetical protein
LHIIFCTGDEGKKYPSPVSAESDLPGCKGRGTNSAKCVPEPVGGNARPDGTVIFRESDKPEWNRVFR